MISRIKTHTALFSVRNCSGSQAFLPTRKPPLRTSVPPTKKKRKEDKGFPLRSSQGTSPDSVKLTKRVSPHEFLEGHSWTTSRRPRPACPPPSSSATQDRTVNFKETGVSEESQGQPSKASRDPEEPKRLGPVRCCLPPMCLQEAGRGPGLLRFQDFWSIGNLYVFRKKL